MSVTKNTKRTSHWQLIQKKPCTTAVKEITSSCRVSGDKLNLNQHNSQVSIVSWVMHTKVGPAEKSSCGTEFHFSITFKTKEFLWENWSKMKSCHC